MYDMTMRSISHLRRSAVACDAVFLLILYQLHVFLAKAAAVIQQGAQQIWDLRQRQQCRLFERHTAAEALMS